ncbi:hypothetical protein EJ03DRAFT_334128 [Teratosphaeria nubilosa]|uniref:Uncharacterized protein n=1 Tax=Teratosphaeria nubilosa TaxID=161662 RepID=A0A6G1LJF5_9PEZI|nr:hypothetical protein EJ03DRAFT_334128 [Teratosphaeria nubilosa]
MPPKKTSDGQNDGDGYTFLVTRNPLTSSAADKKKVRSAAAVSSWPERRKRTYEQFQSSLKHGQVTSEISGPISLATSEPYSRESTPDLPCQCVRCNPQIHRALKRTGRPVLMPSTRKRTANGNIKWLMPTPLPSPPVTSATDSFNCYPVPYKPWFDGLLHHMLTVYAPRGWPALKITRAQGLRWEWFMTQHALSEPALFYVRLLFASGDLVRLRVLQPGVSYWLRDQAIRAINEALKDGRRAISDALILAVGRIALNESMYGDRHAANTIHRPAQQRMIQMRGGMKALDFPDLVKRLMRWSDTVMSKQGGTQRFLEDEDELKNFGMDESVDVLEKWVPQQGQDLRKKIQISDLVND